MYEIIVLEINHYYGPTQPPVQWVPGVLSPGLNRDRGVTLISHPHLMLRSRMIKSYISSPPSTYMAFGGTALALDNLLINKSECVCVFVCLSVCNNTSTVIYIVAQQYI
jgi:hypothetical protein